MPRLLTLALAALAALAFASPARAAGPQVGIADDRILLDGGPGAVQAVDDWAALGIQQVRIYALWNRIAPAAGARAKPKGFKGADPAARGYRWEALDNAVNLVGAHGMKPFLTVTGPGPVWSSAAPKRKDPRYRPKPSEYAAFARAVARRYGDRVDRYVLWNEPNLGSWLRPQAGCAHRRCTAVGGSVYRSLVRAAYPAIHAADRGAQVLIGAMSSRGGNLHTANSTERPLAFLRSLACVDTRFKRLRTGACKHFTPARADGFAFHPHGVLNAPDKPFGDRDDVNLASLSRLEATLDRLQRSHRLSATTRRLGIYIDEYGYQTNPPDRLAGVKPSTQDAWLQRAAYLAWRDPRVKLFTQYLWKDDPPNRNGIFAGWQSGLRYANGRAKPALAHWATPFAMDLPRRRLWGQVRRRDTPAVAVQRRLRGKAAWTTVKTVRPDSQGYWSWRTRLTKGASYRYVTAAATSATLRHR
jgi:hypothetical protein